MHAPTVRDQIVACSLLTPVELENAYTISGGHIHHGEHALDQLLFMRPTPDTARYQSPIQNLFFAGSGSHPGGGVSCGPGYLAAQSILQAGD